MHPALVWASGVAAALVTIGTLWRTMLGPAVRKATDGARALGDFLDDWKGTPAAPARPGREEVLERPGVLARLDHHRDHLDSLDDQLAEQGRQLEEIRHQVLPNGGGSLRDAVGRLERGQVEQGETLTRLEEGQATQAQRLADHVEDSQADRTELHRLVDELAGRIDQLTPPIPEEGP